MKATTGRIVHVKSAHSKEPRPAMVVRSNDDETVDVQIFPLHGANPELVHLQFRSLVPHESIAEPGSLCWYWPERVS